MLTIISNIFRLLEEKLLIVSIDINDIRVLSVCYVQKLALNITAKGPLLRKGAAPCFSQCPDRHPF